MLKIGTSEGKLALWQAVFAQAELARVGIESELVIFPTEGGSGQHLAPDGLDEPLLLNLGGLVNVPSKELEDALLRGEVDLTVHSMNELLPQPFVEKGLAITAVSARLNPSDLLIIRKESFAEKALLKLKTNPMVGTSSNLHKAQLLGFRPDAQCQEIRADAPSLPDRLRAGEYDAVLLAAVEANCFGLDVSGFEVLELPPREFIPVPAQGVLAWLANRDDTATRLVLKKIHHPEVSACTNIERRVLQLLDGKSKDSVGVYCERDDAGNFHAFGICETGGELRRARLSSTTSFGMAKKLVADLTV